METKIIEVTNGDPDQGIYRNWGKFVVGRFDVYEWGRRSVPCPQGSTPLLAAVGWTHDHLLVFDLQTGEGAMFLPGGWAEADLVKRPITRCPLFQPFLDWLYVQDLTDLDLLPDHVHLRDAAFGIASHRRPGPTVAS